MVDPGVNMVTTPNGLHHVRVVGSGAPLVVLPGGPGWGTRYMVESLTRLIGDGRRLFFVDQRGTGESPVGSGPLTMDAYVEDINAIADVLNLDRFDLLGHSFGGLQALKYTIENQGRVGRIVIADGDPPLRSLWRDAFEAGSRLDKRTRPADRAEISTLMAGEDWMSDQKTLDRFLVLEYRPLYTDPATAEHIDHGMDRAGYEQLKATSEAIRSSLGDWDITHELNHVDNPTLLVYCLQSIFDRRVPELMLDLLPNAELAWVEGGHAPFIEDPEAFALAFHGFMGTRWSH